jgi:geranylgeranyl diphosphate synthase type II
MTMPDSDPAALQDLRFWLGASRDAVETDLSAWLDSTEGWPDLLHEATRYALLAGGKRLRPALVRMFCEAQCGAVEPARPAALAIEMVHTYSLVHDDLPCMDDDDLRRGRPTCHKVFGEAMAVLVGDALLTEAFGLIASAPQHAVELVSVLARCAGSAGMVGGQVLDMTLVASAAQAEQVRAVHRAKTAALIGAASELGILCGGGDQDRRTAARDYGIALGLGFQAVDDVLDVVGEAATLGKTPGKDEALDRATLVAVLGLDGARQEAADLANEAREAAHDLGFGPADLPFQLVELLLSRQY